MYDCRETRELLGLYLDSELEAVPTKHVSAHLERCAHCRRESESLRSQDEILARSVRGDQNDTERLRASIIAAAFGRGRTRLPAVAAPRATAWAFAVACGIFIALASLLYSPGLVGVDTASPLHRAAAVNHRACAAEADASDWIRSESAVVGAAKLFFRGEGQLPLGAADGYRLARARFCLLDGNSFLHVVYTGPGGREASLFIGRTDSPPPAGGRHVALAGHTLELSRVAGLNVGSAAAGESLLIAAAAEDRVAVALLASAFAG